MTDHTNQDLTVDDRGRITIGTDYAGETVRVDVRVVPVAARAGCPNGCGELGVYSTSSDAREIRCPACGYVGGRVE